MNGRKPLILFLALVLALWLIFEQISFTRHQDRMLLIFVGCLYAACIVIMIAWVEDWYLRALGVFGTIFGTMLLYFYLARPQNGWIEGRAIPESLIRAFFVGGGMALFIGQILFVQDRLQERRARRQQGASVDSL